MDDLRRRLEALILDPEKECNKYKNDDQSVFSPGHFGVSGRYPLRAEGISADTPCVCTALAQHAAN